jgi:hypothetical protein
MLQAFGALLQSRKFWVGTLTIAAVLAGAVGFEKGYITSATAFVAFVVSVTTTGLGVIGGIAGEDMAQKRARMSAATLEAIAEPVKLADAPKDGAK